MTPRRIGPYAVVRELGARAFTATYRAEQPRLGRTVLVRALKPTVDQSSPFAEELAREAAVLARLDHPGVVRLFEFVDSKEASYLVLEDVDGVPLPALVDAIKLTADQAAAITLDVARALGHAHERGFVHRALRPSIVELREGGAARVVDFSQAKAPRAESLPEPIEVGEPPEHGRGAVAARAAAAAAFVAPEQILGDPPDARANVWSLGALFYTLAAGTPPFVDPRVEGEGEKEVTRRVRGEAPAPIPELPRAYERTIALCLAKDAADRVADGNAVAALLAEALDERDVADPASLVAHALATAKLGPAIAPKPAGPRRARGASGEAALPGPSVRRAARTLPFVAALAVLGAFVLEGARDPEAVAAPPLGDDAPLFAGGKASAPGLLRIVVTPWAEIYVDGEHVDTTPVGRPIPLRPGRHWLTLKHPAAPDEQRSIKVLAGQTVFVDVAMRVTRPPPDAGRPNPDDSP